MSAPRPPSPHDPLDDVEHARPRRPLLELATIGLAVLSAAATWRQTFGLDPLLLPVALGGAVPMVVATLLARRRAIWSVAIELVLFVPCAFLVLAVAGASTPATAIVDGLQRGWGDVLSTAVPVAGDPALLVVPLALTWLTALVAGELVVRTSRVMLPLLAPIGLVAVARSYAPSGAGTATLPIAGVILTGIVFVAARHARLTAGPAPGAGHGSPIASRDAEADAIDARRLARRRSLVAVPVALLATAAGVVVAPRLIPADARPAATLRDARADEVRTPQARDPLDELNGTLADEPSARVFTVSMPASEAGTTAAASRWVLVSLDAFDGTTWTSSARYTRAGTSLPAGPPITVTTAEVHQTFVVDQLPSTWLPAAGRPTQARAPDGRANLAFDPGSGTLATDGDAVPSGFRYDVTSTIARPTSTQLVSARIPATSALAAYVALPANIPREITEATRTAMASAHNPFEQVAALERYLQGNGFVFDPQALTGHSTGDLVRFLSDKPNARHGTAEQFATAFAVMARTRGLPTRLAVGFHARPDATWRTEGDAVSLDVTRGDTDVWPEVFFEGMGWVAFDPVPSNGGTSTRPQLEPEEVAATKSRAADAATSAQPAPAPANNPILQSPDDRGSTPRPWLAIVAIVVGALLVVALVVRIARTLSRRRRRARRGRGEPVDRILGAWHEAIDHLDRAGFGELTAQGRPGRADHLSSATVSEVGDAVAARLGDAAAEPVRALGRIVNHSTFEPEPPTAADADRAWQLEHEIHRTILRRAVTHTGHTQPPSQPSSEPVTEVVATATTSVTGSVQ